MSDYFSYLADRNHESDSALPVTRARVPVPDWGPAVSGGFGGRAFDGFERPEGAEGVEDPFAAEDPIGPRSLASRSEAPPSPAATAQGHRSSRSSFGGREASRGRGAATGDRSDPAGDGADPLAHPSAGPSSDAGQGAIRSAREFEGSTIGEGGPAPTSPEVRWIEPVSNRGAGEPSIPGFAPGTDGDDSELSRLGEAAWFETADEGSHRPRTTADALAEMDRILFAQAGVRPPWLDALPPGEPERSEPAISLEPGTESPVVAPTRPADRPADPRTATFVEPLASAAANQAAPTDPGPAPVTIGSLRIEIVEPVAAPPSRPAPRARAQLGRPSPTSVWGW